MRKLYLLTAQGLKISVRARSIDYMRRDLTQQEIFDLLTMCVVVVSTPQAIFFNGECTSAPMFLKRVIFQVKNET